MTTTAERTACPFLLEVGTEELPADVIEPAIAELREGFERLAHEERLHHGAIAGLGTPRRLSIVVDALATWQEDHVEEVLGPPLSVALTPEGDFTPAAVGFARKSGVRPEDLVRRAGKRGDVLAARLVRPGRPAAEVLAERLPQLIRSISFPKTMRWEASGFRFSRPIRWVVALLGTEAIGFQLADVSADRRTFGHRIHAPGPHELPEAAGYTDRLRQLRILVDPAERVRRIQEGLAAVEDADHRVVPDAALLATVNNLVEWPLVAEGSFEGKYLELPREVLVTVLRHHQKIFSVEDMDGRLSNRFVAVLGTEPRSLGAVLRGYQRVIHARLEDARFYWTEDRKRPLASRVEDLRHVTFLAGAGSLHDRTRRLEQAVDGFARRVAPAAREAAVRAAHLCKADLTTLMVNEFPELQGVMGHRYALADGEDPEVARAIEEHYRPRGAEDAPPASDAGSLVALADKADLIASCYSLGLSPTGSQDPFGVRRAAIGMLRLLLDRSFDIGFRQALDDAFDRLAAQGLAIPEDARHAAHAFVEGRARVLFGERFSPDLVDAVLGAGFDVPADVEARLEALSAGQGDGILAAVGMTFKRIDRIIQGQELTAYDPAGLELDAELRLEAVLREREPELMQALRERDYARALAVLASLRPIVDRFFDDVLIMADDPQVRRNRLGLLQAAKSAFVRVADFSRLRAS